MTENVLLLICRDPDRAEPIARDLERACDRRVEWAATPEGWDVTGELDRCALVFFWLDRADDCESLGAVLQTGATSRRPVPVVAVAERYDERQALTCFRLGVTDYLSLKDHREALPAVIGKLIAGQADVASANPQERPVRGLKALRSHPVLKS